MTKITGVISEAVITGKVTKEVAVKGDVKNTYINNRDSLLKDVEKALSEVVDVPEVTE